MGKRKSEGEWGKRPEPLAIQSRFTSFHCFGADLALHLTGKTIRFQLTA
jgi:hypothetical protein